MPNVEFAELVEIYRHTQFDGNGRGTLTIANERIADAIRKIDSHEDFYDITHIGLPESIDPNIGDTIEINVSSPRYSLGILVHRFDDLFNAPNAAFEEPKDYYVIDARYARGDTPEPETILRYRALLSVVKILRQVASYVVEVQREMVFIGAAKIAMPLTFTEACLSASLREQSDRLLRAFDGQLHGEEKASLLAAAVMEVTSSQRKDQRFSYLLGNLDRICDELEKGYRLFVSSFSYSKIRKEVETAKLDYISKIHKTIVDIQGQLLGIPIGTVVVASQLKPATPYEAAFWANSALLLGVWVFVALLWISVRNQRHTLVALDGEIDSQRQRLSNDHAAVYNDFIDVFNDLKKRIRWHRGALKFVMGLAIVSALLASLAYYKLTRWSPAIVAA